uniref:Uncharacterized protein n=1 Tax=Sphaerodactylus townsendi TaxID=933632 RepID=A0ACB8FRZ2_9SAUR
MCNTCQGEYDCVGETVTCKEPWASCSTSVRKASVSFMDFQTIKKGCARQLFPQESISLNSHMMSLSYQSRFCSEDGCNNETYFVSHPAPANHMRCHTCATQGPWCPEGARTQISCVGDQDQCINLDITGNVGPFSNMKLRGCANFPRCEDTLSFYSGTRTIHATCCDTPLCNSFTPDLHLHAQATNGLECYSCADGDGSGSGCSDKTISTVQCTGIHNMCLEAIGKSRKGNKDLGLMTFKGCASESMCQSSLLALVQELDSTEVLCCQGSLCNTRIVNGMVTESRVDPDSPDFSEDDECAAPSSTTSPSGQATRPGCVYRDEKGEVEVVHAPPESHVDNGTSTAAHDGTLAFNSTSHENEAIASNATSTLLHPGNVAMDDHDSHEDLFTGYSDVETASPEGAKASGHVSTGVSSATTNLDKKVDITSASNHGNVVVLVPIIVPKRTTAITTASSSSSGAINSKEVMGMSNNDEAEFEECEGEDKGISTGEHFIASKERNAASTQSTENTVVHGGDHSNAGVFTAERHGSTHAPATAENTNVDNSHTVHSNGITGGNFNPDEEALVSGSSVGTTHPKNKTPCKRPGSQRPPGVNLMSSPEAEKRVMGEHLTRNDAIHPERSLPGKTHFPDKTNTYSAAFGLTANLGLFSLTLFLATLLH